MDLLVRGYSGYAPDIISNGCIFFGNSDGKKKPIALKTPYFHPSTFEQFKGAIDRQNEIIDPILFKMSLKYAESYGRDPKAFLSLFKGSKQIRTICRLIVGAWKREGSFKECTGDFSGWVDKQWVEEKELFNDILKIIYSVVKK